MNTIAGDNRTRTDDPMSPRFSLTAPRTLRVFVSVCAFLVVLLHIAGAVFPSSRNWGFHQSGFLPAAFRIAIPILMLAMLFPFCQTAVLQGLERALTFLMNRRRGFRILLWWILAIAALSLCWLARERTFFLGDGYLLLRGLPNVIVAEGIPHIFPNEPLAGAVIWEVYRFFIWLGWNSAAELSYRVSSTIFGIGSMIVALQIVKLLTDSRAERFLLWAFVAASGGSALAFGYVENYAPLYFGFLLFTWLSLLYLRHRVHPLLPAIAFGILLTLQFGMVSMVPGFVWLVVVAVWRRRTVLAGVLSVIVMLATAGIILTLCRFSPDALLGIFLGSDRHFLPAISAVGDTQAYGVFGASHFVDLFNLQMLLSPFAPAVAAFLVLVTRHEDRARSDERLFVIVVASCGLIFTGMFNSGAGMSRDWDLMSSYGIGVVLLAAWSLARFVDSSAEKQRMLVVLCSITILNVAGFIAVNAGEESSAERFIRLRDPSLWCKRALLYADDDLASRCRSRRDFRGAARYYREYLAVDSFNNRIWTNLAVVYDSLGEHGAAEYSYRKSVDLGSQMLVVYVTLANCYVTDGRYDDALAVLGKAIIVDPNSAPVNNLMGTVITVARHDYAGALPWYQRCIQIDPTFSEAYLNAGVCCSETGQPGLMRMYWERYLVLQPNGEHSAEIRRSLEDLRSR